MAKKSICFSCQGRVFIVLAALSISLCFTQLSSESLPHKNESAFNISLHNFSRPSEHHIRFPNFEEFAHMYSKNYISSAERNQRRKIYEQNRQQIKQEFNNGCTACGVTKFSDLTLAEFQNKFLSKPSNQTHSMSTTSSLQQNSRILSETQRQSQVPYQIPKQFDWTDHGIITPVKAQQLCGACWAFSTAALYQAVLLKENITTEPYDASEQFLIECTEGNSCQGGSLENSMNQVIETGVPPEEMFPYDYQNIHENICPADADESEPFPKVPYKLLLSKYSQTSEQIQRYLLESPLNIGISASRWRMFHPQNPTDYFSCQETSTQKLEIDHSVLLVGFTEDYWIIKNSWGTDFGHNGYIYINKQSDNKSNCLIGYSLHIFTNQCQVEHCLTCDTANLCRECKRGYYRDYAIKTDEYFEMKCNENSGSAKARADNFSKRSTFCHQSYTPIIVKNVPTFPEQSILLQSC